MKKLATLLLAAGMVISASAPASAVDIKVDGQHQFTFDTTSTGFNGTNTELAKQRLRLGLTMAASENLSGYVQFQMLNGEQFGEAKGTHGSNDTTVRQMYIDWLIPGTAAKVRMGRQLMGLPADAFGCNSVMDAGWGSRDGIVVTSPVNDWLGLTALWSREGYAAWTDGTTSVHDLDRNSSTDMYAVVADLKFNGVEASVYGAFATIDDHWKNGDDGKPTSIFTGSDGLPLYAGNAWWIGATTTFSMFDPFTFKLSAAFGEYNADDVNVTEDTHGWNVQAKASYTMAFGTPVLGAWYFSGDDKDDKGTMPSVGGYFTPTRTLHDAAFAMGGGQCWYLPSGNWGVQAGIEGVSFLKDLSHDLLVTYMQGTNDKANATTDAKYMTEEDSLVSFDFISTYQIYKNFVACLELSYIISDYDDTLEGREAGKLQEDDWRAALNFQYKF